MLSGLLNFDEDLISTMTHMLLEIELPTGGPGLILEVQAPDL